MTKLAVAFRLLITLTLSVPALADPPVAARKFVGNYDAVAKADLEGTLSKGLGPGEALARLGAKYRRPADQAYFKSLSAKIESTAPVAMRSYRAVKAGYTITAPNGREFTVTKVGAQIGVNDQVIATEGVSAREYVESVQGALKKTFVTRNWSDGLILPRAEANPVGIVLAAGVVISALVMAINQMRGPSTQKVTVVQVTDFLKQRKATCEFEKEHEVAFPTSRSADLFEQFEKKQMIATDDSTSCEGLSPDDVEIVAGGSKAQVKITDGEAKQICELNGELKTCLNSYRTAALAKTSAGGAHPPVVGESATGR